MTKIEKFYNNEEPPEIFWYFLGFMVFIGFILYFAFLFIGIPIIIIELFG